MCKLLIIFPLLLGMTQEDAAVQQDPSLTLARLQFERFMAPMDAWLGIGGPKKEMTKSYENFNRVFRDETIWFCLVLDMGDEEEYKLRYRFGLNAKDRKIKKVRYGAEGGDEQEYDQQEDIEEYTLRVRNEAMADLMQQAMKDMKNPDCQDLLKFGKGRLYYLPSEQTDPKNIQKHWKIF